MSKPTLFPLVALSLLAALSVARGEAAAQTTERALAFTRQCLAAYNDHDYQAAFGFCREGLAAGDRNAAEGLGKMYEFGRSVPMDWEKAAYYERMCAQTPNCAQGLGWMYWRGGHGVAQDFAKARLYFGMASARDARIPAVTDSIVALGMMDDDGQGAPANAQSALTHFRRAAALGDDWGAQLAAAFNPPAYVAGTGSQRYMTQEQFVRLNYLQAQDEIQRGVCGMAAHGAGKC
jgi:TPR repeat protein